MKSSEWEGFVRESLKKIDDLPETKNFIYFILISKYFIAHIDQKILKSKISFLTFLTNPNSEMDNNRILKWFIEYFSVELSPLLISYLHKNNTWWEYVINNKIGLYEISSIYETLEEPKKRKSHGAYFTPKSQIRLLCHYSLFFYLKNKDFLMIDDEKLYKIIFKRIFPKDIPDEEYWKFNDVIKNIKTIDPSCGLGTFLIEQIEILLDLVDRNPITKNISDEEKKKTIDNIFFNVFGLDINEMSIRITRLLLMEKYLYYINKSDQSTEFLSSTVSKFNFLHIDFLYYSPSRSLSFDICIGNPPYVRHHELSASGFDKNSNIENFKKEIKLSFPKITLNWDRKADLFVYFWIKAIALIKNKGIVSFVISRAWFSSRYAKPIYQLLNYLFTLDLIIETPFEIWPDAEVRTHIFFGHKDDTRKLKNNIKFLIWKETIDVLLEHTEENLFAPNNLKVGIKYTQDSFDIQAIDSSTYRILNVTYPRQLLSSQNGIFPVLRLDYLEMDPLILIEVLLNNKNKFCLLKELGKIEMGSTTGANWFFYLDRNNAKRRNISINFLHKMTKSPKDWKTFSKITEEYQKYFLYIPTKNKEIISPQLIDYINLHQESILKKPYFKKKKKENWFCVPLIKPDLLIPNMIYNRSFVVFNQDFHIDKQWIGFWANESDWNLFLFGFLNSSLGILLREIQGTKTLGLGSLKLSLREVENLIVLDPRPIPSKLISRLKKLVIKLNNCKIGNIVNDKGETSVHNNDYYSIRAKIDQLILMDYLNFSLETINKINNILEFQIKCRFAMKNLFSYKD